MKTKVLALFLLASSSMFADWRVGFGVGVGPVYRPPARVYVAPPPYRYVAPYSYYAPYEYVAPVPYVRGYWHPDHDRDRWRDRHYDHDRDRHHDRDRDHWRRDR